MTEADLLRVLVQDAERGARDGERDPTLPRDRRAALSLLARFAETVEADEPVAPEVLGYFKRAIERYLVDEVRSMDAALGLVRPAHREAGRRRDRQHEIALRVLELRAKFTLVEATDKAAKEFSVDARTVERALKAMRVRLFPSEIAALKG